MSSAKGTEAAPPRPARRWASRPLVPWLLGGCALLAWGALLAGSLPGRQDGLCIGPSATAASAPGLAAPVLATPLLAAPGLAAPGWTSLLLMLVAMMGPLLWPPVHHVRQGAFASRRGRATLLFLAGYAATWLLAGALLQGIARQLMVRAPSAGFTFLLALLVALLWQASPFRQRALNACHRLPALAAFGWRAEAAALRFGVHHGAACVGTCWALMLVPMTTARGHLAMMALVAVIQLTERQEPPAPPRWGWRPPTRLLRQARFAVGETLGALRKVPRRAQPEAGKVGS